MSYNYQIQTGDVQGLPELVNVVDRISTAFDNAQINVDALALKNGILVGIDDNENDNTIMDNNDFDKFTMEVSGNVVFYNDINMLYGDNSTNLIKIKTDATNVLSINTTGALKIPVGTSGERPVDVSDGQIRYNTTDSIFEGYTQESWQSLGGVRSVTGGTKITAIDDSGLLFFLNDPDNAKLIIDESGNMGFGTLTPSNDFKLDICGNVHLTGTIVSDSDRNIKDNIQRLSNSIETIDVLHGYSYTRKDTEDKTQKHVGVIAQEVEEVYPELVFENKDTHIKSVNYNGLCAVLIECVKDLKKENQDMCSKIEGLEKKINELAKK